MEASSRVSGVLLPVFSVRSRGDFGVGDFGGLEGIFDWLQMAGQQQFMTLPLLPTTLDGSPYSTRSAFGLNPLFIDTRAVLDEYGVKLTADEEQQLGQARDSANVRYELVFPLKLRVLRRAFEVFKARPRPAEFTRFVEAEIRVWGPVAVASGAQPE